MLVFSLNFYLKETTSDLNIHFRHEKHLATLSYSYSILLKVKIKILFLDFKNYQYEEFYNCFWNCRTGICRSKRIHADLRLFE